MSGFTIKSSLQAFGVKATEAELAQKIDRLLLNKKVGDEIQELDIYRVVILLAHQNIKMRETIAEMALLNSNADLKTDISDIKAELVELKATTSRLEDEVTELDGSIDRIVERAEDTFHNNINDIKSELEDRISDAESSISDLSSKLDEVSSDLYLLGPNDG